MNWKTNRQDGFTLIELLVVIAIIGILGSIGYVSLEQSRAEARDVVRVQWVDQLFKAITAYELEKGEYPGQEDVTGVNIHPDCESDFVYDLQSAGYLQELQIDPRAKSGCTRTMLGVNDYFFEWDANFDGVQNCISVNNLETERGKELLRQKYGQDKHVLANQGTDISIGTAEFNYCFDDRIIDAFESESLFIETFETINIEGIEGLMEGLIEDAMEVSALDTAHVAKDTSTINFFEVFGASELHAAIMTDEIMDDLKTRACVDTYTTLFDMLSSLLDTEEGKAALIQEAVNRLVTEGIPRPVAWFAVNSLKDKLQLGVREGLQYLKVSIPDIDTDNNGCISDEENSAYRQAVRNMTMEEYAAISSVVAEYIVEKGDSLDESFVSGFATSFVNINLDNGEKLVVNNGCLCDTCANLDGIQEDVPEGYIVNDSNQCVVDDNADICEDIDGVQTTVPAYAHLVNGKCAIDQCTNIDDVQPEVPEGYYQTPEDVDQTKDGWYRELQCFPEKVFSCESGSRLTDVQLYYPNEEGIYKDWSKNTFSIENVTKNSGAPRSTRHSNALECQFVVSHGNPHWVEEGDCDNPDNWAFGRRGWCDDVRGHSGESEISYFGDFDGDISIAYNNSGSGNTEVENAGTYNQRHIITAEPHTWYVVNKIRIQGLTGCYGWGRLCTGTKELQYVFKKEGGTDPSGRYDFVGAVWNKWSYDAGLQNAFQGSFPPSLPSVTIGDFVVE